MAGNAWKCLAYDPSNTTSISTYSCHMPCPSYDWHITMTVTYDCHMTCMYLGIHDCHIFHDCHMTSLAAGQFHRLLPVNLPVGHLAYSSHMPGIVEFTGKFPGNFMQVIFLSWNMPVIFHRDPPRGGVPPRSILGICLSWHIPGICLSWHIPGICLSWHHACHMPVMAYACHMTRCHMTWPSRPMSTQIGHVQICPVGGLGHDSHIMVILYAGHMTSITPALLFS